MATYYCEGRVRLIRRNSHRGMICYKCEASSNARPIIYLKTYREVELHMLEHLGLAHINQKKYNESMYWVKRDKQELFDISLSELYGYPS